MYMHTCSFLLLVLWHGVYGCTLIRIQCEPSVRVYPYLIRPYATNQVNQVTLLQTVNHTMPVAQNDASSYLATHTGVLGKGWSEVDNFDTLDPDEYDLEDVIIPYMFRIP